jgi:YjbE family integral membrane protein
VSILSLDGVTFDSIMKIVVIDLVLSGDNAVVIAMAVKSLPPAIARKAAIIGAAGAVGLRVVFAAAAAFLLAIPFLQAIGGAILFWIAYKLLIEEEDGEETPGEIHNFAEAVRIIILADLVMSLDNILAVGGASHGNITLLLFGLGLSIPLVLFGSQVLTSMLRRWPALAYLGSGVLAWTAAEMIVHDKKVGPMIDLLNVPRLDTIFCAVATAVVLGLGYLAARRMAARAEAESAAAPAVAADSPAAPSEPSQL